jgi:hypothetical protein
MKKIIYISLICLFAAFLYFYIEDKNYSPLKKTDFEILFPGPTDQIQKSCDIDFLSLSFKGEAFDMYIYKTGKINVNSSYPIYNNLWEGGHISDEGSSSKWQHCPINKKSFKLYQFTLTGAKLNKEECSQSFYNDLNNPQNYYSYVYIDEINTYFLLYSPKKEILYYIRKKGF